MIKAVYICDRCKKEVLWPEFNITFQRFCINRYGRESENGRTPRTPNYYDFCLQCAEVFEELMSNNFCRISGSRSIGS